MRRTYDSHIGEKYNLLKIVSFEKTKKTSYFVCQCDCGNIKKIRCDHVIGGRIISCGCQLNKEKHQSLAGNKFGRLTVIKEIPKKGNMVMWECICDCGTKVQVCSSNLKYGHTQSCGCLRKEKLLKSITKHNLTHTRLFTIHQNMIRRCYDKNQKNYKRYGARGITICDEWLDKKNGMVNFYNWSINNGYSDYLSIDRIDNNGNYEPSNCRWIDNKTQCRNQRSNRYITYKNETKTMIEWSELLDIPYKKIQYRLSKNYPLEKVFAK